MVRGPSPGRSISSVRVIGVLQRASRGSSAEGHRSRRFVEAVLAGRMTVSCCPGQHPGAESLLSLSPVHSSSNITLLLTAIRCYLSSSLRITALFQAARGRSIAVMECQHFRSVDLEQLAGHYTFAKPYDMSQAVKRGQQLLDPTPPTFSSFPSLGVVLFCLSRTTEKYFKIRKRPRRSFHLAVVHYFAILKKASLCHHY